MFGVRKYTFLIFEKSGKSEKIVSGFVSILFLIIEKRDKQKNCARFFRICKYTFLIFKKGDKRKNCDRFFRICNYTF